MTTIFFPLSAVALAVEETLESPLPGLGHGRLADVTAWVVWLLGAVGVR